MMDMRVTSDRTDGSRRDGAETIGTRNRPIRLLNIDDDLVDRKACKRALSKSLSDRLVVLEATTGEEGLEQVRHDRPDCVLLDYRLPDLDGLEFLDRLADEDVPVIMLTGMGNESIAVEAMKRGARDYLIKDFDRRYLDLLPSIIDRVMHQQDAVRERRAAEAQVRESEARFRTLADSAPVLIWMSGTDKQCTYFNKGWLEFTGRSLEQEYGLGWLDSVHPDHRQRCIETYSRAFDARREFKIEYPLRRADGVYRWILDNGTPRHTADGTFAGYIGSCLDIDDRKRAEEALFREKERAQVTLESIADAVITADADGAVDYLNPVAQELTGWSNDEARGLPVETICRLIDETTRQPVPSGVGSCRSGNAATRNFAQHILLIGRDGREFAVHESVAPMRDRRGEVAGAVVVLHDVTHEREMALQLSYQATHDALTGLVNRYEAERRIARALLRAQEDQSEHALAYIDLDQFKVVNDTSGHVAGDELLRQFSALMQSRMRKRDTLARLGGDEFAVLLEHCPLEKARSVVSELLQAVNDFRFQWDAKTFSIGASIGLVAINSESESLAAVMSAADAACYTAKESGRNRVVVYSAEDVLMCRRHGEMQWISRIAQALQENRFRLYAQRISPLAETVEPVPGHYEILLRMVDEQGNLVPPGAFIPAAERYNLMPAIDRWVVRNVIAWYAELLSTRQLADLPRYSINLSGSSLGDERMLETIREELAGNSVPPELLCFEITETAAIANLTEAISFIHELKALGCRFALDDFGSGLSSFAYLKNLPVDYLKIDGNFIRNIVSDANDHAMVQAINRIGQVMSIQTVAEYAENEAILDKLREIGIGHAQGYGVARPMPLEQAAA